VRLIVLRIVVLAVLLQIAPFAGCLDAIGDLATPVALERGQFPFQSQQALGGGQVGRVAHHA